MIKPGIDYEITTLYGECPAQAEGFVFIGLQGCKPFYFRARGNRWSIGIGGDPICTPEWTYHEPFGETSFAAGYITNEEARAFIIQAITAYLDQNAES